MFDLRYHVVSLVAVFLALIVGILIGIGISGRGFVEQSERDLLNDRISDLGRQLDDARRRTREQDAAAAFVPSAYDAVMHDRLHDRQIAILFVGRVDEQLRASVAESVTDAGGQVVRLRSIGVPIDPAALGDAVAARPAVAGFRGEDRLSKLGEALGRELVKGGDTRLWDAVQDELVQERTGASRPAVDAVVVVRSAKPQRGPTADFLHGLYGGLQRAAPTVGAERTTATVSAIPVFRRARMSTVDNVDTVIGRITLAVLLAGDVHGSFGFDEEAVVPPIEPVSAEAGG
jgi:hypothetical protein